MATSPFQPPGGIGVIPPPGIGVSPDVDGYCPPGFWYDVSTNWCWPVGIIYTAPPIIFPPPDPYPPSGGIVYSGPPVTTAPQTPPIVIPSPPITGTFPTLPTPILPAPPIVYSAPPIVFSAPVDLPPPSPILPGGPILIDRTGSFPTVPGPPPPVVVTSAPPVILPPIPPIIVPPNPINIPFPCPDGWLMASDGTCVNPATICKCPPVLIPPVIPTQPTQPVSQPVDNPISVGESDIINVSPINNVDNTINITDNGIQAVSDAVKTGISDAAQQASDIAQQTAKTIGQSIADLASSIGNGVQTALGNIANVISGIASTVWDVLKQVFSNIGDFLGNLINSVKDWLGPVLQNIAGVLDKIVAQVQMINDTLIQPLANLYNSTIGTIGTLTVAIENDLHKGLSGILDIPNQIAQGLGSLDATLDRTVQQLGTVNTTAVKTGITFAGETLPLPFGAAMAKSLGGNPGKSNLTTTFASQDILSTESLTAVSSEAISGLGSLLKSLIGTIVSTAVEPISQLHASWSSVESFFVGLLDGLLGILTTVTAIGALAEPLIDAAQQQARVLVPTTKLNPSTVVEAMKRQFLTAEAGLHEMATQGLDATRLKVLTDLSVFLADVDVALDWWYRGIITADDLTQNMKDHGITDEDQTALKAGSTRLPSIQDLLRWLDFGIQTQDDFRQNAKVLRYDDAQIQATLDSYQQRITPQLRAQLDGVLNNSSIGWFNPSSNSLVPDEMTVAGQRAGMHPDLVKYLWLGHWNLPSVQTFIQSYFRGIRTLTELEARLSMDNVPRELWMDIIQTSQSLIPYRSIPSFVNAGYMTTAQAEKELAGHGFDEAHIQIIMKAVKPKTTSSTTTTAAKIQTLSVSNAKTLWEENALTEDQYTQILEAHGFTPDLAALQVAADKIGAHARQQKQILSDYTLQVESGSLSLDDAISQLTKQNFTPAQILTFQDKIYKSQKVNAKHPSLAQLNQFLKAQLITLDEYQSELQMQGWGEPWLSALLGLVSSGGIPATEPA